MSRNNSLEKPIHRKILLVDDSSINRRIMSRFLQGMNLEVVEAKDGYEAIELIKDHEFSLVFMDIIMPGIDGYETTKLIRTLPGAKKDIPIIAVTSDSVSSITEKMKTSGMSDVLSKPFSKDQLNTLLDSYFHTIVNVLQHLDEDLIIFDKGRFEEFYDDQALRKDIILSFLEEKESDLSRITEAYLSKNNDTIYNALHYLKGSFTYLKATKILHMTQHILDASKDNKIDILLQYEKPFIKYYHKLQNELSVYFKSL